MLKSDGFRAIHVFLTPEHLELLNKICHNTRLSQAGVISYLLDCAEEGTPPNLDEPFEP
jgi:hypothetical protein